MSQLKLSSLLFLLLILLGLSSTASAQPPLVIVLSWDGMRHDFPDKADFPGLKRLESEGIRRSLKPVYPSSTFPGHVSLATGAQPVVHGIIDNQFYDRSKGIYRYSSDANWMEAEPIWVTAEKQGIKAATFFWVGSETEWRGTGATYRISPFSDSVGEAVKVNQILSWIDLPGDKRPGLIMSYWAGVDRVAHDHGISDPRVTAAIHNQDEQLQRLLAGIDERNLWASTTLIIVSDHGMTDVNKASEVKSAIKQAGLDIRVEGGSAIQHLFLSNSKDQPALLELLAKNKNITTYLKADLPKAYKFNHAARTGDIVITTEPPYSLNLSQKYLDSSTTKWFGAHGFSPDYEDMQGIFFIMGNQVDTSKPLAAVHQLNIAPTIAKLLGIDPPPGATESALDY